MKLPLKKIDFTNDFHIYLEIIEYYCNYFFIHLRKDSSSNILLLKLLQNEKMSVNELSTQLMNKYWLLILN